jgi:hypothetical protein
MDDAAHPVGNVEALSRYEGGHDGSKDSSLKLHFDSWKKLEKSVVIMNV